MRFPRSSSPRRPLTIALLALAALPGHFADTGAGAGAGAGTGGAGGASGQGGAGGTGAAGGSGGAGQGGAAGDGGQGGGSGGETQSPVPYDRFAAVVTERNSAQRDLGVRDAEIVQLRAQVTQLQAGDQTGTVTQLQARVTELTTQVQQVNDYFDTLLEAEYGSMPAESAAMVRDIPGGPRERFAYLTKHRARLTGTTGAPSGEGEGKAKGKEGPGHEKAPGAGAKAGASDSAKGYTERQKSATGGGQKSGWASML
jgi:hypothetical protein